MNTRYVGNEEEPYMGNEKEPGKTKTAHTCSIYTPHSLIFPPWLMRGPQRLSRHPVGLEFQIAG